MTLTRRDALKTAAAATLLYPSVVSAAGARVKLRILATTDLHANIHPYDYYRDRPDDTVGLARTASLIKAAREEAPNAILFDNGDLIQGTPLGDYMAYEKGVKLDESHPMIAAMNGLDFACATLGNHEFNYGLDFLRLSYGNAGFPLVCANVLKADGSPLVPPTKIIEREVTDEAGAKHTLKIGVIGFVPPQIMQWDRGHLEGKVTAGDIVEAAEKHVPELRRQSDVVVALCHSGISSSPRRGGEENAALYLARIPGFDAILAGHQHLVFPGKDFAGVSEVDATRGTLHGVPAVMAGFWGSHLGVIDLDLTAIESGWKVTGFDVEARPIYLREGQKVTALVPSEPAVLAAAEPDHQGTLAYIRRPVGETRARISSYWALVSDDPSVQLVAQAQSWYVKTLAKAAGLDLPVLSASAPFKSGGRAGPENYTDVQPGPIAIKDIADIYLYPNTLRAVKVTGADVREWLERSAGIFNTIDPRSTAEQELIRPSFPAFNFDVIEGVQYRIDVTQPSRYDDSGKLVAPDARRIVDLTFDGKPIDDKRMFLVATNNYRAGGGGNFPGLDGKNLAIEAPDTNRDVVVRYIMDQKVFNPSADGNWSFVPLPATAVVTFVTGPKGADAVPSGVRAEKISDQPDGFARYRLKV